MSPKNSMQEALNPIGSRAGTGTPPIGFSISEEAECNAPSPGANNNAAITQSASTDYYAKGSAEVAREDALTLAKIQHVSFV